MSYLDDLALGLSIFGGTVGGLYVGTRLALSEAGSFVEEALQATENTALRLLTNERLSKLVQLGDKALPLIGKGGGLMERLASMVERLLR